MARDHDLEDCRQDIQRMHDDVTRLKGSCTDDARQDLSRLEPQLGRFLREARDAGEKFGNGVRDGFDGLVSSWHDARHRLYGQFRLIEAKGMLASAKRLAEAQYYVAA